MLENKNCESLSHFMKTQLNNKLIYIFLCFTAQPCKCFKFTYLRKEYSLWDTYLTKNVLKSKLFFSSSTM